MAAADMVAIANSTTNWQDKLTRYEEHMKLGISQEKAKQKRWKKPIEVDSDKKSHILSRIKDSLNYTVLQIEPTALGTRGVNARKCNAKPAVDDILQHHQTEQETWNNNAPEQHLSLRSLDQGLQSSKRTAAIHSEILPRCSKRLRKTTKPLIVEEAHPPPLKLPKLHIVLTRNEILEDWFKITGKKYNGKPKKSSIVQLGLGLCTSLTCPSSIRYLKDH